MHIHYFQALYHQFKQFVHLFIEIAWLATQKLLHAKKLTTISNKLSINICICTYLCNTMDIFYGKVLIQFIIAHLDGILVLCTTED